MSSFSPPPSGHSSAQESTLPSSPPSRSARSHIPTPDHRFWRKDWWSSFPNHLLAAGSRKRLWWWQHGYRLKRTEPDLAPASCYVWVYVTCVTKPLPLPVDKYAFVASIGRSIRHHLLSHRIRKPAADGTTSRITPGASGAIARYLKVSTTNPEHQKLLSKLKKLYNPRISNLLLLDWIVMDNLPFSVIEEPQFRRFVELVNQAAKIPGRSIIRRLLDEEYQLAVPYVRKVL
jgi:hypothetical protein